MRLFRFDPDVAHPITTHESRDVAIGRGVRLENPGRVQVMCLYYEAGGVVGYHAAGEALGLPEMSQLLMVVAGEGWVRGEEDSRTPICPGQAAFWEAGEGHESGSDTGMTAIVVEGDGLDPTVYMPEL